MAVICHIGIIPKICGTDFYIIYFVLLENNILESNEKHLFTLFFENPL